MSLLRKNMVCAVLEKCQQARRRLNGKPFSRFGAARGPRFASLTPLDRLGVRSVAKPQIEGVSRAVEASAAGAFSDD
jgi:hypothetical protein